MFFFFRNFKPTLPKDFPLSNIDLKSVFDLIGDVLRFIKSVKKDNVSSKLFRKPFTNAAFQAYARLIGSDCPTYALIDSFIEC